MTSLISYVIKIQIKREREREPLDDQISSSFFKFFFFFFILLLMIFYIIYMTWQDCVAKNSDVDM